MTTPTHCVSAHNLAMDLYELGEVQAARELDEDTLARRRRVLGDDHPDTLNSATSLAADLRALGEVRPPASWLKIPWTVAAASKARAPFR